MSSINNLNQKWRRENKLSLNPNAEGCLTDSPDYSYLDGRPTPYGVRQKNRIIKNRQYAEQIIGLTKEIDFAVERHKNLLENKKNSRQAHIEEKLKPKGLRLLRKH